MRALKLLLLCLVLSTTALVAPPAATAGGGLFVPVTITADRDPGGKGQYHDDVDAEPAAEDLFFHTADVEITGTGEPAQGITLSFQRKVGSKPWKELDTQVTDADGRVSTFYALRGTSKYRWVFDGDETYAASTSNVLGIQAMRDFNASYADRDGFFRFSGDINPGWGDRTVVLQKATCQTCTWSAVKEKRSGADGSWSFRAPEPPTTPGTWYFRAVVPAAGDFVKSHSVTLQTFQPVPPGVARGGSQLFTSIQGSPAQAKGRYADAVDGLEAMPDHVTYEADLVTNQNQQPIPGMTLHLVRAFPPAEFVELGTAVTDGNGHVELTTPVRGTGLYRWVFWGSGEQYAPSGSGDLALTAVRDFNTDVTDLGDRIELGGDLNPGWAGKTVKLQKRTCDGPTCSWTTVRRKPAADHGLWRFRVSRPAGGSVSYRAAIAAGGRFAASRSEPVTVPAD